jgi:hypothetical protein
MRNLLEKCLRKYQSSRSRVEQALGLERRGEARKDSLLLSAVRHRLEIQWQARGVHPWDRHLCLDKKQAIFMEQTLTDTESAIARLFETMPEIDLIDLSVTDPRTDTLMLSGTVHRTDFQNAGHSPSVRMRLTAMGVSFEPLEMDYDYQFQA